MATSSAADGETLGEEEARSDEAEDAKARAAAGEQEESSGGLLGLLTCRKRKSKEEILRETLQRYREIVMSGRRISGPKQEWFEKLAYWSDSKTKSGGRIFVIAPRGPRGEHELWIPMWELFSYAVSIMHDYVVGENKRFALVWVQFSDHRMFSTTLRTFWKSLHQRYLRNLEALHVVHPSWAVRLLRLTLWPVAPDDFWDRWFAHERIEFLDSHMDMKKFKLPSDIYEYDKFLDKQAEKINEDAKTKFGGGFGSAAAEEERKKQAEQIDELQRLLKEQAYSGAGGDKKSD